MDSVDVRNKIGDLDNKTIDINCWYRMELFIRNYI